MPTEVCCSCMSFDGNTLFFCKACMETTGHEQHPVYKTRCRFCTTHLCIALDVDCYLEPGQLKGQDHPAFEWANMVSNWSAASDSRL